MGGFDGGAEGLGKMGARGFCFVWSLALLLMCGRYFYMCYDTLE